MSARASQRKVLAVDDSPEDLAVYRRLLHQAPSGHVYRVVEADSGCSAMEQIAVEQPACILLDYNLPDTNGLDFLKELIRIHGRRQFPVVMVTGEGDESVAVEAIRLGAHDYLRKRDLSSNALYLAIENAVEKASLEQRLDEKQREISQFAHTAAHDLKAPLRTITGFSQLLSEEADSKFDDDERDLLARIRGGAKWMNEMIDGLLAFAAAENQEGAFEEVSLDEVLEHVQDNLAWELREQGVEVAAAPLPVVSGDPVRLRQLLQNLVGNAIKYRGEAPPRISVGAHTEDDEWVIAVADNGLGIDPRFHTCVFAPFKRLHSSGEIQGAGLGLATCRRIVECHGGRIWLDSEVGRGTTVQFTLPVAVPSDGSCTPERAEPASIA